MPNWFYKKAGGWATDQELEKMIVCGECASGGAFTGLQALGAMLSNHVFECSSCDTRFVVCDSVIFQEL